jgi:DNA polymerase-1
MIKHEMENAFKLDVPLTVELGMGKDCSTLEVFSD